MAGSRMPGPLGNSTHSPADSPAIARALADPVSRNRTAIPGPLGTSTHPPAAGSAASSGVAGALAGPVGSTPPANTAVNDPEIETLDLAPTARTAAYALKKAHPSVKFTSGRRNKNDQARAMAGNVVTNRKWIEQTYVNSPLRKKCQDWVDANPKKTTKDEITQGLLAIFNAATDTELGKFSKHLSGMAFDVQPVDKDAEKIKTTIRSLAGLDKFLEKEGGLIRWHAQFN